ncbi:glycosyltransferase [Cuniculiplasma sp. SKW3]|uniref:glycosyltransferase n=1 Tax=unclassified Cuniculiplasma TaxID=2619706 RepID=UPI003FD21990
MNENVDVCVFIRAYNSQKFIKEAINSVFNQNFNGNIFLKILYDEGSTDDTYSVITDISVKLQKGGFDIEVIKHPHASPFRALLNYGFKNFVESYDYFSILDYDCFWDVNYIAMASHTIGKNDFLYSNPIIIDELSRKIGVMGHIPSILDKRFLLRYIILFRNFIDANGIFMSKSCAKLVISKLDLLSSKTFDWIFEDWIIGAIGLYFCTVKKMDQNLVYYRLHSLNTTAGNRIASQNMTNSNRDILSTVSLKVVLTEKMNLPEQIAYLFTALSVVIRKIYLRI